jgi:hypothetical protein
VGCCSVVRGISFRRRAAGKDLKLDFAQFVSVVTVQVVGVLDYSSAALLMR